MAAARKSAGSACGGRGRPARDGRGQHRPHVCGPGAGHPRRDAADPCARAAAGAGLRGDGRIRDAGCGAGRSGWCRWRGCGGTWAGATRRPCMRRGVAQMYIFSCCGWVESVYGGAQHSRMYLERLSCVTGGIPAGFMLTFRLPWGHSCAWHRLHGLLHVPRASLRLLPVCVCLADLSVQCCCHIDYTLCSGREFPGSRVSIEITCTG